jgi:hypothetical protein
MMEDPKVREHCSDNLSAAAKEIAVIKEMVRPDVSIDEDTFKMRMAHLYWHLNLAWNCRNETAGEIAGEYSDQNNTFAEGYPDDLVPSRLTTALSACWGGCDSNR